MSVQVTALAFVDDAGHFKLDNRDQFHEAITVFAGKEVVVTVKQKPRRQGNQQLRYLRGVVIPDIARACGYTDPDEWESVYDGLMWKFRRLPDGPFGEPRRMSAAKDKMPMNELSKLIDELIVYGETSIPGCRIRRPGEVDLETAFEPDWE